MKTLTGLSFFGQNSQQKLKLRKYPKKQKTNIYLYIYIFYVVMR